MADRAGESDQVGNYIGLQVRRWKVTVKEIEDVLDRCIRGDEQIHDLRRRCNAVIGGQESDLEKGQEAMVLARVKAQAQHRSKAKTAQERKMELWELRRELAISNQEVIAQAQPELGYDEAPLSPSSNFKVTSEKLDAVAMTKLSKNSSEIAPGQLGDGDLISVSPRLQGAGASAVAGRASVATTAAAPVRDGSVGAAGARQLKPDRGGRL
mmetsp:Transcript_52805/g.113070  ORF Transcript_52805/g.113070 Transcript_52805/m.113070 type:complete len:211 (-) Transcript_52805:65-697(-)